MKVAKASFSQMPFHHFMVTRSPEPHVGEFVGDDVHHPLQLGLGHGVGSTSSSTSRKVTQPRFSMAPKAKSGTATRSSLSPG